MNRSTLLPWFHGLLCCVMNVCINYFNIVFLFWFWVSNVIWFVLILFIILANYFLGVGLCLVEFKFMDM